MKRVIPRAFMAISDSRASEHGVACRMPGDQAPPVVGDPHMRDTLIGLGTGGDAEAGQQSAPPQHGSMAVEGGDHPKSGLLLQAVGGIADDSPPQGFSDHGAGDRMQRTEAAGCRDPEQLLLGNAGAQTHLGNDRRDAFARPHKNLIARP